jgi:acyl dehydratase
VTERDPFIPAETYALLGAETAPGRPRLVDRNTIRQFADAVGSTNPLFRDEATPESGRVLAPLSFPIYNVPNGTDRDFDLKLPLTRRVRGGDDCEFFAPVQEGDVLTAQTKLVDVQHRTGGTGDLIITTYETRYTNQRSELVMIERPTGVWR